MKHFLELLEAKEDLEYLISESINELTVSEFNQLHEAGIIGNTFSKGKRFVQKVMGDKTNIQTLTTNMINKGESLGDITRQNIRSINNITPKRSVNKANNEVNRIRKLASEPLSAVDRIFKKGRYYDSLFYPQDIDRATKQLNTIKSKRSDDIINALQSRKSRRNSATNAYNDYKQSKQDLTNAKQDVLKARKIATGGLWPTKK